MNPMLRANNNAPARIKSSAISILPNPACDGKFCFASINSYILIGSTKVAEFFLLKNAFQAITGGKTDEWRDKIGELRDGLFIVPPVSDKAYPCGDEC